MAQIETVPLQAPPMPEALESLAKTSKFASDDLLADAARRIMTKHTRKLYQHLPGVVTGDDPHDVHQARVSTRRLRACLEATALAFNEEPVRDLRRRLRGLAAVLGEVRDRDVLLMRLRSDAKQYADAEHGSLDEVIAQVEQERAVAHQELLREIDRKRTRRLLDALTEFLVCPLEQVQARAELPLLVRHYAGSAIMQRYEAVRRFETLVEGASSEQLHDLRIACKHLRYTIELFQPALPDTVEGALKLVEEMQEHLGDLHDADVALVYLGAEPGQIEQGDEEIMVVKASSNGAASHAAEEAPAADALHAYIAQRQQQRIELLEGVMPLWNRLTNVPTRRKLAGAIALL